MKASGKKIMEQVTVKTLPFSFLKNYFELQEKRIDSEGRLLIEKLKIKSVMYILCNLYTPTKES